jgi:hypothetical protein
LGVRSVSQRRGLDGMSALGRSNLQDSVTRKISALAAKQHLRLKTPEALGSLGTAICRGGTTAAASSNRELYGPRPGDTLLTAAIEPKGD